MPRTINADFFGGSFIGDASLDFKEASVERTSTAAQSIRAMSRSRTPIRSTSIDGLSRIRRRASLERHERRDHIDRCIQLVEPGAIIESGGIVNLGGTFTLAGLGTLRRNGGAVILTGTLDNTGTTLNVGTGSALGTLALNAGTIATAPSTMPRWHYGPRPP